jgi:tetratricopeptide (TPR) repeat protein
MVLRPWPWLAVFSLWAIAFSLACRLTAAREATPAADTSVAGALLGGTRTALSANLYETADEFFHRGVEHTRRRVLDDTLFRAAKREVSPERHIHLQGSGIREILPWLRAATQLDPHNIQVYLVTAYWLAGGMRRPDLALDVLREAQANNPFDYEVHTEKGRILLRQGKRAEAGHEFDAGLAFWPGNQDPASEDARLGRQNLLLHRALMDEMDGRMTNAVRLLKDILVMAPQRMHIQERIDSLMQGAAPAVPASSILESLLGEGDRQRNQCEEEANRDTP